MTGPIVLVLRLVATAALYAFLGLALWIMWHEFRRAAGSTASHRVPPIRLEVRARGQRAAVKVFTQPEVVVGRDPLSDVSLTDKGVSARHARLSFHDGQWWVDDLESTNGTRLNRERLLLPTVLTSGDEIKCGGTRLLVTLPQHQYAKQVESGGRDG